MFTGIIQHKVVVHSFIDDCFAIKNPWPVEKLWLGQSIAIDGCCLTLVECSSEELIFNVSPESIDKTTLSQYKQSHCDMFVNLELCLTQNATLDGHMVSGHVDGVAKLMDVQKIEGSYHALRFEIDEALLKQNMLINKGSVCINGVSLTINDTKDNTFSVMIIPKTWELTNLSHLEQGQLVNIEFDMIGKYIMKSMQTYLNDETVLKKIIDIQNKTMQ